MEVHFRKAVRDDAQTQLEIQRKAYLPLYEKYGDEESPANMTIDEITGKIENPFGSYYVIYADEIAAGGIYAHPISDNGEVMYLCGIYILPSLQGKKLSQKAISFVESLYPNCRRWVLEVPEKEAKNIHVYEKAGYRKTEEKEVINDKLTIVTYIKDL